MILLTVLEYCYNIILLFSFAIIGEALWPANTDHCKHIIIIYFLHALCIPIYICDARYHGITCRYWLPARVGYCDITESLYMSHDPTLDPAARDS